PQVLLATVSQQSGLGRVGPMAKIVDVRAWPNPTEGPHFTHVAVGRPRSILILIDDRGLAAPVRGAVYAYHEVDADHRLDDAAWVEQVDRAPRPAWAVPDAAR
ncbi:MAG: DUF3160 domain-containing protein, partial [Myxococcota bacterium]